MSKSKFLNLYYDQEADVLYFSKGKPSGDDLSDEIADEVIIRKNPETKEVTGFTVLNFSKKAKRDNQSIKLPLKVDLIQTSFV